MSIDPLRRFSTRATAYARGRPSYPRELIPLLRDEAGLADGSTIADVGSGTGKLTEVLLRGGFRTIAIEPNSEMRAVAEATLGSEPSFMSIDGTAEATALPDRSVDAVTAAQAFHWFDPVRVRTEWERIVRPLGWAVLLWNLRRVGTPFMVAYDRLIHRFATDMKLAKAERADPDAMSTLFRGRPYETRMLGHVQAMDLATLSGRVVSSSFMPNEGDARYDEMLAAIGEIFDEHAREGAVRFEYDTPVYFGRLGKGSDPFV